MYLMKLLLGIATLLHEFPILIPIQHPGKEELQQIPRLLLVGHFLSLRNCCHRGKSNRFFFS